ncbi:MAG: hypothetical protein V4549_03655 [Bacteroidota bacterium]
MTLNEAKQELKDFENWIESNDPVSALVLNRTEIKDLIDVIKIIIREEQMQKDAEIAKIAMREGVISHTAERILNQ